MIHGVGTDICKIGRIAQALGRHGERFAQKILGPREMEVYRARCEGHPQRGVRYVATRFAAKEALSKALGIGLRAPMTWPAAQLLNADNGKPAFVWDGALRDYMEANRLTAQVSVSDEEDYAVAFAIVERQSE
ncbi:holo-ACP synthase [Pseudoduganella plicata]|uniref:Holo-[acyl-carrier-protein] synthase n=1 Tax=Pseudoduganella plicata TaxID=321984 RepID=A0A4P7BB75_9BURK|nr:holo-ACP synthase [Pseudoduganella plicata]QBQ35851.1 holo-ACP synthase [Pseudoduganella plicata]GGY94574.1 holo-[acyl-carrier-protein] synthase [Pseudoduganella plicata]